MLSFQLHRAEGLPLDIEGQVESTAAVRDNLDLLLRDDLDALVRKGFRVCRRVGLENR